VKEKIFEAGLNEIEDICKFLLEILKTEGIVLLEGDLAAGKTTLVKAFARYLHLDVSKVSSPTFSIMNEYEEKIRHYDIYQKGINGFLQSGLLETLGEKDRYYFIEWADEEFETMLKNMGFDYVKVVIETKEKKRIYKVNVDAYTQSR
jgi:tRNA threonylcarbamoyladenosine biosynthesis protein TsaE